MADPPRTLQELAEAYPPRTSTDRSVASPVFSTFSLQNDPEPRLSLDRSAAGVEKEENPPLEVTLQLLTNLPFPEPGSEQVPEQYREVYTPPEY